MTATCVLYALTRAVFRNTILDSFVENQFRFQSRNEVKSLHSFRLNTSQQLVVSSNY